MTEGLFCEHLAVFSETWPTSGSMRSGVAYQRPAWEPATSDSACSSSHGDEALVFLHTPDTMPDAPNSGSNTRSKPPGLGNQMVALGVKMLPTPTTQDAANNGGPSQLDRNTPPLNAVIRMLGESV